MSRYCFVGLALLAAVLCGLANPAPAQINPGDYLVTTSSSTGSALVRVIPGGRKVRSL